MVYFTLTCRILHVKYMKIYPSLLIFVIFVYKIIFSYLSSCKNTLLLTHRCILKKFSSHKTFGHVKFKTLMLLKIHYQDIGLIFPCPLRNFTILYWKAHGPTITSSFKKKYLRRLTDYLDLPLCVFIIKKYIIQNC